MNHFRSFEIQALHLLGDDTLGKDLVEAIIKESEFVSCEYSGVGYFLTVRHHLLPKARVVLSSPTVLGHSGEIGGHYLAFVEDLELMLEYASWTSVPNTFRDLDVTVEVHTSAP